MSRRHRPALDPLVAPIGALATVAVAAALTPLRETAFAATRSERHHFVGWHHDTAPYLRSLSMLAFPSVSTETFGRVSIEAQACGVPVLASDIGGIPETLLPGETGLLLPPGNLAAWRDAILALCDEGLRQTMGTAARGFVERHFALPVIADAFVAQLRTARAPRSATLTGLDAGSG